MKWQLIVAAAVLMSVQVAHADLYLSAESNSVVGVYSSNDLATQCALLITTDGTVATNNVYFTGTNMGIAEPDYLINSVGQSTYDAQLEAFESVLGLNIQQWFSVDFLDENNTNQTLPDGLLVDFNATNAPVTVYL